ncbi:hypothetical protein PV08_08145 [Exophiala spinifera]|uniref:Nitrate reductase [NADPH] n=1 Tax=Exophiala spinifera TaxID=91928 RepID=A0A0D2B238_9EURO|nr:uncharacterized protein PV08_08145 [Exophiala spinifera]KIW12958.1 hypothetical protein PV08_08145 [Exophiala spinifera]
MSTFSWRCGPCISKAYSSPLTSTCSWRICSAKVTSLVPFRPVSTTSRRPQEHHRRSIWKYVGAAVLASATVAGSVFEWKDAHAEASPNIAHLQKRYIRLGEVERHGRNSDRKWVTKGSRVFDITEWIEAHPGGPVILQAVGGSIDRYWDIFSIHKKQDVYDILEQYCIGEVDPRDLVDGKVPEDKIEDPFQSDPARDPRLLRHTDKPCNAETPSQEIAESFITPNRLFFVRNHFWVPKIDEGKHVLHVELPDGTEKAYSVAELKSNFKPFSITATLQCTGNRRKHMSENAKPASGLPWDVGAISNSLWTGVRLRDVLADAGYSLDRDIGDDDVRHVHLVGAEAYSGSIPISKAVDPHGDVMLAYEMGGQPLPRDHGYPLRALIPGHTAARSVKWLERVVLSEEESQSQWQQRDYKCFGPNQASMDVDWSSAPAIQETPVQGAITAVSVLSRDSRKGRADLTKYGIEEDAIRVEGYAFSGGGREIVRVDISADDGKTWSQAELRSDETQGHKSWSWKRWEWVIPKATAGRVFVVKAVDDSYNSQPESYDAQWNFRGNLTNAWHRVALSEDDQNADASPKQSWFWRMLRKLS